LRLLPYAPCLGDLRHSALPALPPAAVLLFCRTAPQLGCGCFPIPLWRFAARRCLLPFLYSAAPPLSPAAAASLCALLLAICGTAPPAAAPRIAALQAASE